MAVVVVDLDAGTRRTARGAAIVLATTLAPLGNGTSRRRRRCWDGGGRSGSGGLSSGSGVGVVAGVAGEHGGPGDSVAGKGLVDVDFDAGVGALVSAGEADGGRGGVAAASDVDLGALHLRRIVSPTPTLNLKKKRT